MDSPDYATSADLKLLRDRVDLLQIAATEKQQPWYKQRPSLASLLALGASIVTFVISQHGSKSAGDSFETGGPTQTVNRRGHFADRRARPAHAYFGPSQTRPNFVGD